MSRSSEQYKKAVILECCKHNPRKWRAVKESATPLVSKNSTTGNRLKTDRHGDDNQELKKL